MKKIVILENNGGQLANQLWQYANIYAYSLEVGCEIENWSFFRYYNYFNLNKITNNLLCNFFYTKKFTSLIKFLYGQYCLMYKIFSPSLILKSRINFYLPPSRNTDRNHNNILKKIGLDAKVRYFCGWNFRNPDGLIKYHSEIKKYFKPKEIYFNEVTDFISRARENNKVLVGVHIRQGDYRKWNNGIYYFSCSEVRIILDNFLANRTNPSEVVFIICSDEDIEDEIFYGLNYIKGLGKSILDLYTLALTDMIIGSVSTYGQWASYYGQVNMINFSRDNINWNNCFEYNYSNNPWLIYNN